MERRPLIEESLQVLSFLNLNPFSTSTGLIRRIYGICTAMIVIFTFIDVSLYLSFTYQVIDSAIFQVVLIVAFSQTTIKIFFMLAYKWEIMLLINNISLFWKPNINEHEQQLENDKIYFFVKICIRFYVVLLLATTLFYFIRSLLLVEVAELPWGTCFSKFFSYRVCYLIEAIVTPFLVSTTVGFDTLYVSLITNIICEFKFVENRFPKLKINPAVRGTDKEAMEELRSLINHHNLILGCIKIMKQLYRSPMLGLFFSNMFGMCFALIVMTSSTSNKTIKFLFGMVTMFYLVQFFFYCMCGSMLADESAKISAQVYKSKWWIKTQPELRKALVMVIRRSNQPEILTAGGLLQVNLETFRMILRSTVSFFTFMQVIYGNP